MQRTSTTKQKKRNIKKEWYKLVEEYANLYAIVDEEKS